MDVDDDSRDHGWDEGRVGYYDVVVYGLLQMGMTDDAVSINIIRFEMSWTCTQMSRFVVVNIHSSL